MYMPFAGPQYIREIHNRPLEALASRICSMNEVLHLPPWMNGWMVSEARRFGIDAAVMLIPPDNRLSQSGTKLTVNGTFEGLKTNAVSAKLQNGIVAGVRGPAFADLTITKAMSGTITGSADLDPQQLQNLKKGGIYVQIYTEKPTDGTLWGWLLH